MGSCLSNFYLQEDNHITIDVINPLVHVTLYNNSYLDQVKNIVPMITCPITHEEFERPVVAADGHTYEFIAIYQWFRHCNQRNQSITSPVTGQVLTTVKCYPNYSVQYLQRVLREKRRQKQRETEDNEDGSEGQIILRVST